MIKVLFFARYRELLGLSEYRVSHVPVGMSISSFKRQLIAENDPLWATVLDADNIIQAVNHTVVDDDHVICDGDEVAFFPPVTGG